MRARAGMRARLFAGAVRLTIRVQAQAQARSTEVEAEEQRAQSAAACAACALTLLPGAGVEKHGLVRVGPRELLAGVLRKQRHNGQRSDSSNSHRLVRPAAYLALLGRDAVLQRALVEGVGGEHRQRCIDRYEATRAASQQAAQTRERVVSLWRVPHLGACGTALGDARAECPAGSGARTETVRARSQQTMSEGRRQ